MQSTFLLLSKCIQRVIKYAGCILIKHGEVFGFGCLCLLLSFRGLLGFCRITINNRVWSEGKKK